MRRLLFLLLAAAAPFAATAQPASQPSSDATGPKASEPAKSAKADLPYMREVDWLRKPDPYSLFSAWPKTGNATKGQGRISCIVTITGSLRDCEVVSETPEGSGFGGAALSMAPQFLLKPATSEGKLIEAQVTIPVNFDCQGECPKGGATVLRGIVWAKAPTVADLAAVFPKKALQKGLSGVVSLQCKINVQQSLSNCRTMTEEPVGHGFANAATRLTEKFQTPTNPPASGKVIGDLTRLRFSFTPQFVSELSPAVPSPRWTAVATPAEILAAQGQRPVAGQARMRCKVVEDGALADCVVAVEAPAGAGLGAAALSLAPKYRAANWTEEGLPVVGASVELTINFASRPTAAKP